MQTWVRTAPLIFCLLASRILLAAASPADTADISLCLLLRDPQKYAGREATMTVGYRAGFEWQELVCAACGMTEKVWAEFDADVKGARKLGKFTGRFDSLYRVRVRGVLSARGHYGHSNGYDYEFRVSEILAAKRLWQMTPHQPKPPANTLRDACAPQPIAQSDENADPWRAIPVTRRQSLIDSIVHLLEFERAENWAAIADVTPVHHFHGETKEQWIARMRRGDSLFGKKLLAHRVDAVNDTGVGEFAVWGCAKLSGQQRGYRTVILASWEEDRWQLFGPEPVMGLDQPPERCEMTASDEKNGRVSNVGSTER